MKHKTNTKLNHGIRFGSPKALGKDAKLLLLSSALYTIAVALSNTFVNVYLWKIEKDYLLIGLFNLYQYIAITVLFIIAGRLSKLVDRVILHRIGVTVLTVFYTLVLLLGTKAVDYYIIIGLVLGIGEGLYWYSFNILYFEITDPDNRDIFNGWNGLLTSIGGVIAPFLSGWFLAKQKGITGYKIIFFISLIIFAFAIIVSFFFHKRISKGKYQLKKVLREAWVNTNWKSIFLGMLAQGGREGVIIFLVGLLIYIDTNNEFTLGNYTMIISAVASITYYLVGKFLKKQHRKVAMMIGTIMMAIVVIPMFIKISYINLLIYGIGTSIFAPLYFIPLTSITFDVIGQTDTSGELRGEYVVLRETGLNIGRIIITILFLILVKTEIENLKYLLLLSGSLQMVTWYFIRAVKDEK